MEKPFAKLGLFFKDNLKMEGKFCQNDMKYGVIKPVGKLVDEIKKLIKKQFIDYTNHFCEWFLILSGKLFYRLYQVSAFYRKAHSPSLFMTAHSRNQEFKFCSELGRNFDNVDRLHFVDNGKIAANFYKSPFEPPVEYQLYAHDSENERKKSSRISNAFIYRSTETITETKYNNKTTAKTKKRVYKELMSNFFAYLICCEQDQAFQRVPFQVFCGDNSVFRYLVNHYNIDVNNVQSDKEWIDEIMVEVLRQLGIRNLNDISDGTVLISHLGSKRGHVEMSMSESDMDNSSVDSNKKTEKMEGNLNSLLMLAELATRKH